MTPGMTQQEALALLNLNGGATTDDVKRAYRARIRSTHPDLASDDEDRLRRERDAMLVNVALKTLTDYGTGPAATSEQSTPTSPPRAPKSSAGSTRVHQGAPGSSAHSGPGEKQSTDAHGKSQGPNERPRHATDPDGATKPSSAPATLTVASAGLLLLHALFSLNFWYGLSLAMRAAPFVLIGAALRAMGFWTGPFTSDVYAELSPTSGVWTIAFWSLAAVVLIGAIGNSRLATFTLVVAAVVYGSFIEALAHLSWYQHAFMAGLIVVLPAVIILRHPINVGITWLRAGIAGK